MCFFGCREIFLIQKPTNNNLTLQLLIKRIYPPKESSLKNSLRGPICLSALFNFVLFVLYWKRNLTFLVSEAEIRLFETSKISYLNEEDGDDEAFFVVPKRFFNFSETLHTLSS